ncbi:hypothetical protein H6771_00555 [Candidatus Peribacteria bacterium]|nr:hypothetical protein [Candidatus Peribacteria bacterium]
MKKIIIFVSFLVFSSYIAAQCTDYTNVNIANRVISLTDSSYYFSCGLNPTYPVILEDHLPGVEYITLQEGKITPGGAMTIFPDSCALIGGHTLGPPPGDSLRVEVGGLEPHIYVHLNKLTTETVKGDNIPVAEIVFENHSSGSHNFNSAMGHGVWFTFSGLPNNGITGAFYTSFGTQYGSPFLIHNGSNYVPLNGWLYPNTTWILTIKLELSPTITSDTVIDYFINQVKVNIDQNYPSCLLVDTASISLQVWQYPLLSVWSSAPSADTTTIAVSGEYEVLEFAVTALRGPVQLTDLYFSNTNNCDGSFRLYNSTGTQLTSSQMIQNIVHLYIPPSFPVVQMGDTIVFSITYEYYAPSPSSEVFMQLALYGLPPYYGVQATSQATGDALDPAYNCIALQGASCSGYLDTGNVCIGSPFQFE